MTFDEEFNSFSNSPDGATGTWMTSYPYGGAAARTLAGNHEAEYYSDSSVGVNPFGLSNGVLSINATPGSNPAGLPYNSGLITTDKSFAQTYGYFEVKAQLPAGQGLWPAFWMLPASNNYTSELDIFEVIGGRADKVNATVHGTYGTTWDAHLQEFTVPDTSAGFHTYGTDWEPGTTTYYMDGKVIGSAATPDSMNDPMFMMLNLAVGGKGSWPGAPDATTTFPATMKIDYVHAYATANTTYVGGPAAISANTSAPSGSGADTMTLSVSEDGWKGDAQFTVSIDGKPLGTTYTATASHAAGAAQDVSIAGTWGPSAHSVGITFINDASGGTAATDRNLYVNGVNYDGRSPPQGTAALTSNGTANFTVAAASTATSITLNMAEDAYLGDAQYSLAIDGTQVGTTGTVTASNAQSASQAITLSQSLSAGSHDLAISFLNDAYGNNGSGDRNLYVKSIDVNSTPLSGSSFNLMSNSTDHISFVVPQS